MTPTNFRQNAIAFLETHHPTGYKIAIGKTQARYTKQPSRLMPLSLVPILADLPDTFLALTTDQAQADILLRDHLISKLGN